MEDDLKAIKKGQSPSGVELQKVPEQTPVVPPAAKSPVPPPPSFVPRPNIQVELGKTEKAKPLAGSKPTFQLPSSPLPPPVVPRPNVRVDMGKIEKAKTIETPRVSLPPSPVAPLPQRPVATPAPAPLVVPTTGSSGSSKKLYIIVAIVLVIGVAGWLGYSLFGDMLTSTPTPTPIVIEPTPTPTPLSPTESLFGTNLPSISIATSGEPYALLKTAITAQTVDIGKLMFYKITDEVGGRYSFPAMLSRFVISHPEALNTTDPTGEVLLSLYGSIDGKKKVSLIIPLISGADIRATMTEWEATMPKDLTTLLGLGKKKTANFLADNYRGVDFRYIQMPNSSLGIAHTQIRGFLIISSAKDSFQSLMDYIEIGGGGGVR